MFELTLDKAKELVLKAIEEKGEGYVYENPDGHDSCSYVHGDVPGCLVGHVLFAAGVPLEWMSDLEGDSASGVLGLAEIGGLLATSGSVRTFLRDIQECQDSENTWGDSYKYALERI